MVNFHIYFFSILIYQFVFCSLLMAQELADLRLSVLENEVEIKSGSTAIELHVKVTNITDKNFLFYRFYSESPYLMADTLLPHYHHSFGITVAVFSKKGELLTPNMIIACSVTDMQNIMTAPSVDSAMSYLKAKFGDPEQMWVKEQKEIVKSRSLIAPHDSVEIKLDIELKDYELEKGEYTLIIYYIMNAKIFEYIDKDVDVIMGYRKSNPVKLIIK